MDWLEAFDFHPPGPRDLRLPESTSAMRYVALYVHALVFPEESDARARI